jgi:kynurenine 3-monooxygenase
MMEIRSISIPVDKRGIHLQDGSYVTQNYGKGGNLFTFRGILNRKYEDLAEKEGVQFFFLIKKIWDVTLNDATTQVKTERGEWTEIKFDKVLEPMVLFTY